MSPRQGYLLDTNILSETRKRQPEPRVMRFLENAEPSALFISVLTIGELRKGVALKGRNDADAARQLSAWVDGLEYSFADRLLGVDAKTATLWGEASAERPRPVVDTLLAATAIEHKLTLVTRNTADVSDMQVALINPWES